MLFLRNSTDGSRELPQGVSSISLIMKGLGLVACCIYKEMCLKEAEESASLPATNRLGFQKMIESEKAGIPEGMALQVA